MEQVAVCVEDLGVTYRRTVSGAGLGGLLRRRRQLVPALKGISFRVEQGEILGYIGPNGAGKTTTLKVLAGALRPQRGKVRVLGYVPWRRERGFLRGISFVMSGRGLLEEITWDLPVLDGFALVKDLYGLSGREFRRNLDELIDLFGLRDILGVPLRQLSHGQRARVELAAALLWRPRLLLLDEPTLGLDILSQAALREYVREYVRRTGAACIVTSHYMRDIEDLAQRALLLDRGEIVAEGSPGELARRFSGARVLRVVFEREVPGDELRRLGELEEFNGNEAVILVPAAKTKEAAQTLLECFPVHDLTIEEPDLEEALRSYFREAG
jgi:ABC-2 type transport system ATP-binding protein